MKALHVRNTAIALIAGMSLMATPLYADMHGQGMMGDQKGGMTQMSGMMHDMADSMMSMSGDMGKGGMSAARQKQMGDRMREMSMMVGALLAMAILRENVGFWRLAGCGVLIMGVIALAGA